jgi:hypothetical protein
LTDRLFITALEAIAEPFFVLDTNRFLIERLLGGVYDVSRKRQLLPNPPRDAGGHRLISLAGRSEAKNFSCNIFARTVFFLIQLVRRISFSDDIRSILTLSKAVSATLIPPSQLRSRPASKERSRSVAWNRIKSFHRASIATTIEFFLNQLHG